MNRYIKSQIVYLDKLQRFLLIPRSRHGNLIVILLLFLYRSRSLTDLTPLSELSHNVSLCFPKGALAIPSLWMSIKSVLPGSPFVEIASVGYFALLRNYKSSNPSYP